METKKFHIERSKTGKPVIVEEGGGMTNTGGCQIVAGKHGERVEPLFVPSGHSNATHALFVARKGMIIIEASRDRNGEIATAWRITRILKAGKAKDGDDHLVAEKIAEYEEREGFDTRPLLNNRRKKNGKHTDTTG